jgi:hypothetical protein
MSVALDMVWNHNITARSDQTEFERRWDSEQRSDKKSRRAGKKSAQSAKRRKQERDAKICNRATRAAPNEEVWLFGPRASVALPCLPSAQSERRKSQDFSRKDVDWQAFWCDRAKGNEER